MKGAFTDYYGRGQSSDFGGSSMVLACLTTMKVVPLGGIQKGVRPLLEGVWGNPQKNTRKGGRMGRRALSVNPSTDRRFRLAVRPDPVEELVASDALK